MKIAVWHNLPSGGGKRALYDHIRGLVARGHTIEAWCPSTADQTYLPLSDIVQEHILPFAYQPLRARGPLGKFLALDQDLPAKLKAMDKHCRQCAEQINAGGFDVLFANSCVLFRAAHIGRYVHLPKVLYLQEPYRDLYEASPRLSWLYGDAPQLPWVALSASKGSHYSMRGFKNRFSDARVTKALRAQAREELQNARAFDAVLVNSFFSRESILRAYGINARVCYLGVNSSLFANLNLPREDFVMGIGAFQPAKNVEFVIDAIGHMPVPRPRLVWVGDSQYGGYCERMEEKARALNVNLETRVRVTDEELVRLLNRASALVYAPRLEPFGYAPIEAGACGLPVVAVAEGGVRETVIDGESGLLVNAAPEDMASALNYLCHNPAAGQQLGEGGLRLSREKWNLTAALDRLEAHLVRVIEEASHSTKSL